MKMKAPLFEKLTWNQAQIITEGGGHDETGKQKDLFMKGIFIQGGIKNQNQRIYPVNEISKAVNQINEAMKRGETIWGEADHPEELTINLDRVSHMVTDLYMEGNNGIGKLKIVPTPMGNIIRTLVECGGKLGVSSRGSGNVTDNGNVSDFEIVTVDIVARPSAPDAYPKPVYESLLRGRRAGIISDLAEAVNHDRQAQKYLKKEVLTWLDKLFEGNT